MEAVISLARSLGMAAIAEGVETDAQQRFLTRLGSNALQGYLLGHPLPAEGFIADIQHAENAVMPDKSCA